MDKFITHAKMICGNYTLSAVSLTPKKPKTRKYDIFNFR